MRGQGLIPEIDAPRSGGYWWRQRRNNGETADMRRAFGLAAGVSLLALVTSLSAIAAPLDAVSSKDASSGLRAALSQGVDKAIGLLGTPNGFLGNPKYTIPLPPALEKADRALRMIGLSGDADELKAAMNHAAESAVADARPVFKQAVQHMTVSDAKSILTGGETSATDYFRQATATQLTARFKPIVAHATAQLKLRGLYDQYAGKAAQLGLVSSQDANLNEYVTARALDGLFGAIGEEERAIRRDPMGQASSLIKKVFGAL
jgi:microcompartment protein CcmL/EutN